MVDESGGQWYCQGERGSQSWNSHQMRWDGSRLGRGSSERDGTCERLGSHWDHRQAGEGEREREGEVGKEMK